MFVGLKQEMNELGESQSTLKQFSSWEDGQFFQVCDCLSVYCIVENNLQIWCL